MRNRYSLHWLVMVVGLGCLAWGLIRPGQAHNSAVKGPVLRRPVALALLDDGKWLFVANRRSGTVSVIDAPGQRLAGEVAVGRGLSDLAATPDGKHLLATDEEAGRLLILRRQGPKLEVSGSVEVSPTPVSVQLAAGGRTALVASLWSRRLAVVDLGNPPRVLSTVELPLAPRRQLLVPGTDRLIIADSFGGRLAVVDLGRGAVESVRPLPAHNIRGLALTPDGKGLLLAHQVLNHLGTTARDDIHWGNLVTNNVRTLSLEQVLAPRGDLLLGSSLHQLGVVDRGGADPSGLAAAADGTMAVALAGVNEVALGPGPQGDWSRVTVGRRPTALALSPDGGRLYVANTFGDSITVVDVRGGKVVAEVGLGKSPELSASDRGELLFHDARLAHDGWFSCHSCHTDGHTNGLLNDNLTDGSYNTPKRILTLRGVADTGPWAWDGRMADLETQIRTSIKTTMSGKPLTDAQVKDLAAYLRALPPPPPVGSSKADRAAVQRGQKVFTAQGCSNCHEPPTFTSAKTYRVWPEGGAFNPPSLRGVGQGERFFHDNRAASLEEVFTRHRHQLTGALSGEELRDLLAYLRGL
ncbi:MAG: c-type cytochrome [Gemmataceae bacterium]|nr:c-type cytochrome [Gemmataceae bacterium]